MLQIKKYLFNKKGSMSVSCPTSGTHNQQNLGFLQADRGNTSRGSIEMQFPRVALDPTTSRVSTQCNAKKTGEQFGYCGNTVAGHVLALNSNFTTYTHNIRTPCKKSF